MPQITTRKELHVTKSFLRYVLMALGLAFCTCTVAYGMAFGPHPHPSPEIDPGMAISALTLLAGSLAVLRIRRNK
jgi:hypothetical protein